MGPVSSGTRSRRLFGARCGPLPQDHVLGSPEPSLHLPQERSPRSSEQGAPYPRLSPRVYAPRVSGEAVGAEPVSAGSPAGQDGNDKKATVAVMRFRLLTRELFEGFDSHRGDCPRHREPLSGDSPAGMHETRRTPSRLRGATNPQLPCGANRRGGAKPRGRNTIGAWRRRSDGSFGFPEWTHRRYIGSRAPNPTRGGTNARRSQRSRERSEGEGKVTRVAFPRLRP
jgi:hypothetical protein